jgi:hypothetical protein
VRVHPHLVYPIRNQVRLPSQFRDPEAVVGIRRQQFHEGGRRVGWVAHRNVQLVCCHDTEFGITEFPPVLVPDDRDVQCSRGLRSILDGVDYPGSGQKQHSHDQNRNHGPSQLDLRAAVHLGRLATGIARLTSKLHHRVGEQTSDDDEDNTSHDQHKHGQSDDRLRRRGGRGENTRRAKRGSGRHGDGCGYVREEGREYQ